jgi:hypothetical protein
MKAAILARTPKIPTSRCDGNPPSMAGPEKASAFCQINMRLFGDAVQKSRHFVKSIQKKAIIQQV